MPATRITDITPTVAPVVKRKYRSKGERRRIAEETLAPGASVAVIARAHGVNANQVFQWRKLYHEGRLGPATASTQLIPVRVADVVSQDVRPAVSASGAIHIEMGKVRLRVEGKVDPECLRLILEQLAR
jgi:transposase